MIFSIIHNFKRKYKYVDENLYEYIEYLAQN